MNVEELFNIFASIPAVKMFADYTPKELSELIEGDGELPQEIRVGAVRNILLNNGVDAQIVIISELNHDKKVSGKRSLTFAVLCKNLVLKMNQDWTNAGGWDKTYARTVVMNGILQLLPQEWQDVIKPVYKYGRLARSKRIVETVDKLFIPSLTEFGFGDDCYNYAQEGDVYEFFKDHKHLSVLPNRWNFTRSPYAGNYGYFCSVTSDDPYGSNYANGTNGVVPCFAI